VRAAHARERPRAQQGFATANDEAFALSSGEIILLLNPDTELYPDALTALVEAFDSDDSIGIAGCKLYTLTGRPPARGRVRKGQRAYHALRGRRAGRGPVRRDA